jgi:ribonuclease VapC
VIVDSSVLVAILLRQPGYEPLLDQLAAEPAPVVGAPTLTETGIVLAARMGVAGKTLLARFVQESGLVVVTFGEAHWGAAVDAFLRFGKGRDPAGLNFGDCLTYAAARLADQPLLCLGDDFTKTDLELISAHPSS